MNLRKTNILQKVCYICIIEHPFISKPVQLRILDAIMEDIRSIERDTDGLLDEIMK